MPKAFLRIRCRIRIEAQQHLLVLQRVLLLHHTALADCAALDRTQHTLHLGAVDQLGQIGLGDEIRRDQEVALQLAGLGGATVDGVERCESGRRPDHEAAEVASGSELEEVEGVDRAGLDAGDVAEGEHEVFAILFRLIDDEGPTALLVTAATELAFASAQLARILDFLELRGSAYSGEQCDGLGGLLDGAVGECGGGYDKRDFRDGADVMATSHEQSSGGRSGDSRCGGEALLAKVDLLVPLAPDLGGCEHATGSAHVTEGGLTGAVSTSTGDTRNTCNSATCNISVC